MQSEFYKGNPAKNVYFTLLTAIFKGEPPSKFDWCGLCCENLATLYITELQLPAAAMVITLGKLNEMLWL